MLVAKTFLFFLALGRISSENRTFFDYVADKLEAKKSSSSVDRCQGKSGTTQILLLLDHIMKNYMRGCINIILYEKRFEFEEASMNFNLKKFLMDFPEGYVNGQVKKCLFFFPFLNNFYFTFFYFFFRFQNR